MSRILLVSSLLAASALSVAACSSDSDPFAAVPDASGGGGTVDAASGAPDGGGGGEVDAGGGGPLLTCTPIPTRFVVLGDSITDCTVIGGPDSADCVSKKVFDYIKAEYAPEVTYLNVAVGGAQTDGMAQQLQNVPGGPGHVLVMIYIGGNDLAPYIFQSDAAAQQAYEEILPGVVQDWVDMFTFFADTERFPDGYTVIMNNQYNPFDDCTAAPYYLSQTKTNLLHMFNVVLGDIANQYFQTTILIDQFTPFLGHGHHHADAECPYYMPNMEGFMADLIHANGPGNVLLAEQVYKGVDQLYKDCP
jgi:GDSL-like lipase/acylhydrolase family protein